MLDVLLVFFDNQRETSTKTECVSHGYEQGRPVAAVSMAYTGSSLFHT